MNHLLVDPCADEENDNVSVGWLGSKLTQRVWILRGEFVQDDVVHVVVVFDPCCHEIRVEYSIQNQGKGWESSQATEYDDKCSLQDGAKCDPCRDV